MQITGTPSATKRLGSMGTAKNTNGGGQKSSGLIMFFMLRAVGEGLKILKIFFDQMCGLSVVPLYLWWFQNPLKNRRQRERACFKELLLRYVSSHNFLSKSDIRWKCVRMILGIDGAVGAVGACFVFMYRENSNLVENCQRFQTNWFYNIRML